MGQLNLLNLETPQLTPEIKAAMLQNPGIYSNWCQFGDRYLEVLLRGCRTEDRIVDYLQSIGRRTTKEEIAEAIELNNQQVGKLLSLMIHKSGIHATPGLCREKIPRRRQFLWWFDAQQEALLVTTQTGDRRPLNGPRLVQFGGGWAVSITANGRLHCLTNQFDYQSDAWKQYWARYAGASKPYKSPAPRKIELNECLNLLQESRAKLRPQHIAYRISKRDGVPCNSRRVAGLLTRAVLRQTPGLQSQKIRGKIFYWVEGESKGVAA